MQRPSERFSGDDLPLLRWMPTPKIVPFPSKNRTDLIERNARRMAELRDDKAIAHLDRTLDAIAARLARIGIHSARIETDIAECRGAILDRYRMLRARSGGIGE